MSNNLEALDNKQLDKANNSDAHASLSNSAMDLMKQASVEKSAAAVTPAGLAHPHADSSMYPDSSLTPGAIFTDVTEADVCRPGYSKSVRNVPESEKAQVFQEYGVDRVPGKYEVDHLISLELGGSNDITNLWPEAYEPRPGAHEKDAVENYLHKQVCSDHTMTLKEAQDAISTDWYKVYQEMQQGK